MKFQVNVYEGGERRGAYWMVLGFPLLTTAELNELLNSGALMHAIAGTRCVATTTKREYPPNSVVVDFGLAANADAGEKQR